MKIKKWYHRLQYENGNHQMVRVDNIPVVKNVIESDSFQDWKKLLEAKVNVAAAAGENVNVEPYVIKMSSEDFDILQKEVNRKLNIVEKYNFDEFNLVFNSRSLPIIKILKL